jgi:ppGpp synthetase/RelA/SpoT-type nucleotidyltranferase
VNTKKLPARLCKQIDDAVEEYTRHRTDFYNLAKRVENDLVENQALRPHIHSTKFREKDPERLRDKLRRKALEALDAKKEFKIDAGNLFANIDDLAGVRLLHIYREQLREIDPLIQEILAFHKYKFREKPKAYTWDIENREFYSNLGFRVETNPSFYTSVHYIVEPHWRKWGCELQVRTLAEELWGEVSHRVNYPHPTESVACGEQIAVLARVASGCTRLVDSIFASAKEFDGFQKRSE